MFLFCSNSRSPLLRGGCNASDRFQRGEGGPPEDASIRASSRGGERKCRCHRRLGKPSVQAPGARVKILADRKRVQRGEWPIRPAPRPVRARQSPLTNQALFDQTFLQKARRRRTWPRTGKRSAEKCRVGGVDDATKTFGRYWRPRPLVSPKGAGEKEMKASLGTFLSARLKARELARAWNPRMGKTR
jgi:hypothetical protein